jgi:hypothetical protein
VDDGRVAAQRRTAPRERDALLKPYRVAATVLLVLGALCLLVELQSPSLVYWTGERVPATNDGGIVYYEVHGEQRTLNDRREPPAHPQAATVYADPDDASRDHLGGIGKAFDAVFVLSPFVAAGAVVLVGLVRRRQFRRRVAANARRPS